jgi:competence protein ComEA
MTTSKFNRLGTLISLILVAIIAISGIVVWSKYSGSQPIEISQSSSQELHGEIYIGGAVNNPGSYPLTVGDSIEALIQAAGGTTDNANFNQFKLYIPEVGEDEPPQKIDINRAEIWLLKALPEIGEVRAQAIVSYRCQDGPFHNINELIKVEGIGTTTYEQIKELITVAD